MNMHASNKRKCLWFFVTIVCGGVGVFLMGMSIERAHETPEDVQEGERYVNDPRSIRTLLADSDVRASIDVREIVQGGVLKDGIPAIDTPVVVHVVDVPAWLDASGDGIAFATGESARFYPYQVLVRHEIVNDTVEGRPLLVTYCPLCYTGIVFDRRIGEQTPSFGVSGVLHHSNLLMYNRSDPESLWAQASGEAVVGAATGEQLEILPFDITTLAAFAEAYPEGEVVIGEVGTDESTYQENPYGGDLRDPDLRFPTPGEKDTRLGPTDRIVGLVIGEYARAYHIPAVEAGAPFEEDFAGRRVRVDWDQDLGAVRVFDITDGREVRQALSAAFWFSWVSTYPETSLYR